MIRPWPVEVVQADQGYFSRGGGAAKLPGGLRAAEAEQPGGLGPRVAVADEKFPHPPQAGEVPGAHGFGPLRLADREQDALPRGVVAGYHDVDLVGGLALRVVDHAVAGL